MSFLHTPVGPGRVKTWMKLERALLLKFRERYGEIPKFNSQGRNMRWTDEQEYFSVNRIANIIEEYDA